VLSRRPPRSPSPVVNDNPDAQDDERVTDEDVSVEIDVLANDDDPDINDQGNLSVSVNDFPANGTADASGGVITYTPNPDFFGTNSFSYTLDDGNGGTSTATVTVTVNEVNDDPNVASGIEEAFTDNDGATDVDLLLFTDDVETSVEDLEVVGLSLVSGDNSGITQSADGRSLVIDTTAYDSLQIGESEIIVYDYTIEDSDGGFSSQSATITIEGANDAPVINQGADLEPSVPENIGGTVGNYAATDVDTDAEDISYTHSGADANDFTLDDEGNLAFVNAPDFEDPSDEDENNVYEVTITTSDNNTDDPQTASVDVQVTVTDVVETAPVFTGGDDVVDLSDDALVLTDEDVTLTDAGPFLNALGGDDVITLIDDESGQVAGGTINGGAGNDTFIVTSGLMDVEGGEGIDTLDLSNLPIRVSTSLYENGSIDVDGDSLPDMAHSGIENAIGTAFNDSISGFGDQDNRIEGGLGNDFLGGDDGNDTLLGEAGDDDLRGGAGSDILTGGEGDDDLYGSALTPLLGDGDDVLDGGAGDDFLTGGDGADELLGGDGNDYLYDDSTFSAGGLFADFVDAGAGDDNLIIRGGGDTVDGGAGTDDLRFEGYFISVDTSIDFSAGGTATLTGDGSTFTNIETVSFFQAGSGNDTYIGLTSVDNFMGGAGNDVASGGAGDDTLSGEAGNDELRGGEGSDRLFGGDGDDLIEGGAGDDSSLSGGAGRDTIRGGDGNDTFMSGGAGDDIIDGGAGNDHIRGGEGDDTIDGGEGDDFLRGGDNSIASAGMDTIRGGAGSDTLHDDDTAGSADADVLSGGEGDDSIYSLGGGDTIEGGEGTDLLSLNLSRSTADLSIDLSTAETETLVGDGGTISSIERVRLELGSSNDSVTGTERDDFIFHNGGDDVIRGGDGNNNITFNLDNGAGNDELFGGAGNDSIQGGEGDDVIDGGDGSDSNLQGDEGADRFVVSRGDDNYADFNLAEGDIFDLSGLLPDVPASQLDDYLTVTSNFTIDIDLDGAGAGTEVATIHAPSNAVSFQDEGGNALTAAQLIEADYFVAPDVPDNAILTISAQTSVDINLGETDFGFIASGELLVADSDAGDTVTFSDGSGVVGESRSGGAEEDVISGTIGDDVLSGLAGDDDLSGGNGADTLDGGSDNDTLTGGFGADRFIVSEGSDIITDFSLAEGDVLDFSNLVSLGDGETLDDYVTITDAANGVLGIDTDGDGTDDAQLTLTGVDLRDGEGVGLSVEDLLAQGYIENNLI